MIDVIQKEVYEKQFGDLIEIARNDFMEHFDTKQKHIEIK